MKKQKGSRKHLHSVLSYFMGSKKTKEDLVRPLINSEIKAKDIVLALTQEDNGLVRLILRHKKILGKLDLNQRVITIPVTFKDCDFMGEVDLSNSEFEQSVDFSGCTFHKGFNSGADTGTHTVYKKDFICREAVFKEEASFVGSHFESVATFSNTTFENEDKKADFQLATFEKYLKCEGVTFNGPADFRGIRCEAVGFFGPAEVSQDEGSIGTRVVTFEKEVLFRFAYFRLNLQCNQARFKGAADFSSMRCDGNGLFELCTFEDESAAVSFVRTSFGGSLFCIGATFRGDAYISEVNCHSGGFFHPASLGGEDSNSYRAVSFNKVADFRFSTFGINLDCRNATFRGPAIFAGVSCDDNIVLSSAKFEHKSEAADENEIVSVDLSRISIEGTLYLIEKVAVQGRASFYNASIGILALGDECELPEGKLDLRELTFTRFDSSWARAKQFAEAQDPTLFSRDPYIQLERYYTSVGKDDQADDIYYEGHAALRDNAKDPNGSVEWSPTTDAMNWVWKWLTRYGVSIWRLLALAIAFVVVGSFVFHIPDLWLSHDMLKLASDSVKAAAWEEGLLYMAAYSFDLFIPLVDLHIDNKWTPNAPLLEAYAILHTMVGWLIVPLLIAALAGIMRR